MKQSPMSVNTSTRPTHSAPKTYTVTRECCILGHCSKCRDLPFGKTRRIEHAQYDDLGFVYDFVLPAWQAYNPSVKRIES